MASQEFTRPNNKSSKNEDARWVCGILRETRLGTTINRTRWASLCGGQDMGSET